MVNANLILPQLNYSSSQKFKRRETLPLREVALWQIESGVVRTLTLAEDGIIIPLGFWGAGHVVGQALSRIQPYQIECLTDVRACCLESERFWQTEYAAKVGEVSSPPAASERYRHVHQVMLEHIHQVQELLRIRSGQIFQRLQQLLNWLAYKFGHPTERGQLIELRLTHQDIADAIGTTRVTVTRLLHQFERKGWISISRQQGILLHRSLTASCDSTF
jgi:CRP-like cAMP-binding protein